MKKFLKLLLSAVLVIGMGSCKKEQNQDYVTKWEYKTLIAWPEDLGLGNKFVNNVIPVPAEELNKLGQEGWELVTVYTEIQTVHPNFGNDKYVTGLQPNTRTQGVFYVFKRPIRDDYNSSKGENTNYIVSIVGGINETEVADSTATGVP